MKSSRKSKPYIAICLVFIVIVAIVGIATWRYQMNTKIQPTTKAERHTITGIVTQKSSPTLSDSGQYLYVDDLLIQTSNSGSLHTGDDFDVDTSDISKGDKVKVRYIDEPSSGATLNCPDCYIKKI